MALVPRSPAHFTAPPPAPRTHGPSLLACCCVGRVACRLQDQWRLGRWTLKGRLLLAPMEQVTDCAFRRLCSEQGASYTFTEMVRGASLLKRNRSTLGRVDTLDPSTPTSVQLMVSGPKELRQVLEARKMSSVSRKTS